MESSNTKNQLRNYFKTENTQFIKNALEKLKSSDEMEIISALNELSCQLSMASDNVTEDIKTVELIHQLIILLDKFPMIPEISLISLNCLNYILDINPHSTNHIIKYNGVQKIISMTQNVESIENVENAIKCIEKMSFENPYILIEKNAFINILTFIDFFELSIRKSALKACVNMSKVGNNIDYIRNHILKAIPNLTNLSKLNGNSEIEKTIVDLAIQSIYNILNGVKNYNYSMDFNDFCEDIIKDGLINVLLDNFIKFINVEEKKEIKNNIFNVNVDTIKNILKIFELLCIMSNNIANTLLNKNMLELIYKVIKNEINYNKNDGSKVNSSNTHSLFNELFNLLSSFFPNQLNKNNINLLKTKIMSDENKNYYDFFSEKILILLIENILNIPSSSTTLGVIKIIKMYIANSKNDYIQKYIDDNQLSNSISKMLDSKDSSYIIEVLSLVYLIMNKIPELFIISFLRDGVVENVSKLNQIEENNLYIAKQTNVSILKIFDNVIDNPKENENHIILAIRCTSKNLTTKYFHMDNIKKLIKNVNGGINPIEIMNKLIDYKLILKENKVNEVKIIEDIINLLIDNDCTFFEIEKSEIILYLSYYIDNNFLLNYNNTNELDMKTNVKLSGEYNKNIIEKISSLFSALNFNENEDEKNNKIMKFLQILQRCISSMNCFKLFLYDNYNNIKNSTSLFLSAFNGNIPSKFTQKIGFKFNYNENYNKIIISKEINSDNDFSKFIEFLNKNKCNKLYFDSSATIEQVKKEIFNYPNKENRNQENNQDDYFQEIFRYIIEKDSIQSNKDDKHNFEFSENIIQNLAKKRIERMKQNIENLSEEKQEKDNKEKKEEILKINSEELSNKYDIILYIIKQNGEIYEMNKNLTLNEFLKDAKKNLKKSDFSYFCNDFTFNFSFINKETDNINLSVDNNNTKINLKYFDYETLLDENIELEKFLFEKFYYSRIINNKALYNIKRASPFFYLLSLIHLSSNKFSNLFKIHEIPINHFENIKMTSLLSKQIKDPYAVCTKSIPSWCTEVNSNFPFFTSFNSRYLLFKVTAFDNKRSMTNLYIFLRNFLGENIFEDKSINNVITNLKRIKFKIHRDNLLEDSFKLMNEVNNYNGYIEFEYYNESGTGMGPTLEYYSLFTKEIIENHKDLWYKTEDYSLFPIPFIKAENYEKKLKLFNVIGYVIARALYDDRLIDFPLNSIFWDLVLERPINIKSIQKIDKNIFSFLEKIYELKRKTKGDDKIIIDGKNLESLDIYFNCPWNELNPLKENGENILLKDNNVDEYIILVFKYLLIDGMKEIKKSFIEGFNKVFDINLLKSFSSKEIEECICGSENSEIKDDNWSYENLTLNIIPMHGLNKNSLVYKGLIEILLKMNKNERKLFLLFVTGSPRLPIGGFKNLYPKLTVVKAQTEINKFDNPDLHLPSVMTCQNYLKIPNYSSFDILKQKLFIAIQEGRNAFYLS